MRVAYFGFDAAEASHIRRVRSLIAAGADVTALTMRRDNMRRQGTQPWRNIHLGTVANESPGRRAAAAAAALPRALRRMPRTSDLVIARNLDMLAIAAAARAALRPRPPLVYECLDVHGMMTDSGRNGAAARWIERRLLAACDAVIVSSPAFLTHHFRARQGWRGAEVVLENKIWFGGAPPPRPAPGAPSAFAHGPLRLGWIGTLRCPKSLALLDAAARALAPRLRILCHGVVHRHAVPGFDAVLRSNTAFEYHGEYRYPDDLATVYAGCDAVWAQDLWQWGTNSSWLLPNRIYEAGYFGCPAIAAAPSETAAKIARDDLGWVIDAPTPEALAALLAGLDPATIAERRAAILARPARDFVLEGEDMRRLLQSLAERRSP